MMRPYKIPYSVLVLIHSADHQVLLLERADAPGFWQSVTGSLEPGETPAQAAVRELREETGLEAGEGVLRDWGFVARYAIFERWRHRYAPGVTHNLEQTFSLCLPAARPVRLSPREHLRQVWLPWAAAAERCFSWSNADAIRHLGEGRVAGLCDG